jgi:membrane-bound serine protease (ClpP class)
VRRQRTHRRESQITRDPWRKVRIAFLSLLTILSIAPPVYARPEIKPRSAIITVRGEVTDVLRDTIIRRIEEASDSGADVLIFEIDTFGGYVTSGIEIHQTIQGLPDHIRTIAWVNQKAISAGAMIAMSCDEIWMNRSSSIGDCAPILMGETEIGEAERAKMESPILNVFRDSAARHDYPTLLARAMVQVGTEVWWIERVDAAAGEVPERRFVDGEEKRRLVGVTSDDEVDKRDIFDSDDPNVSGREWRLVPIEPEDIENPVGGRFEIKQPIDGAQELLTLTQSEAVIFGFAKGIASDLNELAVELDIQRPEVLETNSWEHFAAWLNNPAIRGIFFLLAIIGGYIEFQSPGLIIPGAVGLTALVIFFAAPYVAGLQYYWPIALLIVGAILLSIELTIPGFGILGFAGLFAIFVALVGTFLPTGVPQSPGWVPSMGEAWQATKTAMQVLALSVIGSVAGLFILLKYMPHLPLARGIVLGNPEGVTLPSYTKPVDVAEVGDIGVVVGHLKPAGSVRFGNDIVDAMSQGEYVQPGVKVQVIRREGMNIVVRPLPDTTA